MPSETLEVLQFVTERDDKVSAQIHNLSHKQGQANDLLENLTSLIMQQNSDREALIAATHKLKKRTLLLKQTVEKLKGT